MTSKPSKKKKAIPKRLRTKVWENEFGKSYIGKCCCCQIKIEVTNWHCGHVKAEAQGGLTTEENLRPVCSQCNLSMGTKNMQEFSKLFRKSTCLLL